MASILSLTYKNRGLRGQTDAGPNISFASRHLKRFGAAGGRMGSSGFETMSDWLGSLSLMARIGDGFYWAPQSAKSELINQWSAENTQELAAHFAAKGRPDVVLIEGLDADTDIPKQLEEEGALEASSVDELLDMLRGPAVPKKTKPPRPDVIKKMEEALAGQARKKDEAAHKRLRRSREQGNKQTLEQAVEQMLAQPENLGVWA